MRLILAMIAIATSAHAAPPMAFDWMWQSATETTQGGLPDVPTIDLVGWWRFGATTSGSDVIGGYDASLIGNAQFTQYGLLSDGLFTSGAYTAHTTAHWATNYTYAFWTYRTNYPGTTIVYLMSKWNNSAAQGDDSGSLRGVQITAFSGTTIRNLAGDASATLANHFVAAGIEETNVWSHWAATYSNGASRIYKNGVLVGSLTGTAGVPTPTIEPLRFLTPYPETSTSIGWDGYIDEAMLYRRPLASNEVFQIYTNTLSTHTGTP